MSKPLRLPVLPTEVRDLAFRLGASEKRVGSKVVLEQRGTMRSAPEAKLMSFKAHQTIALDNAAFEWRAKCGPLGAVSVTDYLRQDSWGVRVRLIGSIPLATFIDSPAAAKGETMRYLAELPWAPDAMLRNSHLVWEVLDKRTFVVSSRNVAGDCNVTLRLSPQGLVASIETSNRPRIEGNLTVERSWRGLFSEYQCFGGRTVPTRAEVSWMLPAGVFKTWEGRITKWALK